MEQNDNTQQNNAEDEAPLTYLAETCLWISLRLFLVFYSFVYLASCHTASSVFVSLLFMVVGLVFVTLIIFPSVTVVKTIVCIIHPQSLCCLLSFSPLDYVTSDCCFLGFWCLFSLLYFYSYYYPTQGFLGIIVTYTRVVCDPESETLVIQIKRYFLGYFFKCCLSPLPDGHYNLRDVTAFNAYFTDTRKNHTTNSFEVTTANGSIIYHVDMDLYSGRRILKWMNSYLHRRGVQNTQVQNTNNAPATNNVQTEEEIRVETAHPSDQHSSSSFQSSS